MIRQIIKIDEDLCNGCGLCAQACQEGAIAMVNGKARLVREDYCDGLGNCLPACPTGAISFEEREAPAFDEAAVKKAQAAAQVPFSGCPGSMARTLRRPSDLQQAETPAQDVSCGSVESELTHWPVQIKLVPVRAPWLDNASLLIAADCTAFAYGDFHRKFLKNHVVMIGCPKLDEGDYAEKLTEILKNNQIRNVHVVRMQVPCCGGIENAVKRALQNSGKMIPWRVTVIAPDGQIVEE
ncbi:MAG: 4Fe-4S ferredoxin-type domain-containing protein [Oscillospiraceae bacterium]|jgi:ferredoxin